MSDLKAKMHLIRFPLGLRFTLDPAGGAYNAPQDPLAVYTSRVGRRKGKEKAKGRGRGEEGGQKGPHFVLALGPPKG